jgi:hypothetical protein
MVQNKKQKNDVIDVDEDEEEGLGGSQTKNKDDTNVPLMVEVYTIYIQTNLNNAKPTWDDRSGKLKRFRIGTTSNTIVEYSSMKFKSSWMPKKGEKNFDSLKVKCSLSFLKYYSLQKNLQHLILLTLFQF